MRPTRHHKKTNKGLGALVEEEEAPPPSSRGVTAVPPSEPSPGRYSVRPAASTTREFSSPVGQTRRKTNRMPLVVDDTPRASTVVEATGAASITPRRLPAAERLEDLVLGSHEALLLERIDGSASLETLMDGAAMSRREVIAALDRLVQLKLVALHR